MVVFGIGLAAGFVDAIAGGGGLIMLPGLLFTGLPVGSAIATNKLCGTFGALTSALKFAQAKQIDKRACLLMGLPVITGAYVGSRSIGLLPVALAEPIVIALMIVITLFVVLQPSLGTKKDSDVKALPSRPKQNVSSMLAGGAIGFHDGFFGPGTGVFLCLPCFHCDRSTSCVQQAPPKFSTFWPMLPRSLPSSLAAILITQKVSTARQALLSVLFWALASLPKKGSLSSNPFL